MRQKELKMEEEIKRQQFAEYIRKNASLLDSKEYPEKFSPIIVDIEKIKLKGDE